MSTVRRKCRISGVLRTACRKSLQTRVWTLFSHRRSWTVSAPAVPCGTVPSSLSLRDCQSIRPVQCAAPRRSAASKPGASCTGHRRESWSQGTAQNRRTREQGSQVAHVVMDATASKPLGNVVADPWLCPPSVLCSGARCLCHLHVRQPRETTGRAHTHTKVLSTHPSRQAPRAHPRAPLSASASCQVTPVVQLPPVVPQAIHVFLGLPQCSLVLGSFFAYCMGGRSLGSFPIPSIFPSLTGIWGIDELIPGCVFSWNPIVPLFAAPTPPHEWSVSHHSSVVEAPEVLPLRRVSEALAIISAFLSRHHPVDLNFKTSATNLCGPKSLLATLSQNCGSFIFFHNVLIDRVVLFLWDTHSSSFFLLDLDVILRILFSHSLINFVFS